MSAACYGAGMKSYEIVIGALAVAAVVASEALSWSLSGGTLAMLGALAGFVLPNPSAMVRRAKKKA